jgi:hypothetical protein
VGRGGAWYPNAFVQPGLGSIKHYPNVIYTLGHRKNEVKEVTSPATTYLRSRTLPIFFRMASFSDAFLAAGCGLIHCLGASRNQSFKPSRIVSRYQRGHTKCIHPEPSLHSHHDALDYRLNESRAARRSFRCDLNLSCHHSVYMAGPSLVHS